MKVSDILTKTLSRCRVIDLEDYTEHVIIERHGEEEYKIIKLHESVKSLEDIEDLDIHWIKAGLNDGLPCVDYVTSETLTGAPVSVEETMRMIERAIDGAAALMGDDGNAL